MVTESGARGSKGTNIVGGRDCPGFPSGVDTVDTVDSWTLSNVDPEVDREPGPGA